MRRYQAVFALVLITAIWGSTFIIVKQSLDLLGPFAFIAARFWLAGLTLLLCLLPRRHKVSPRLVRDGVLAGLALTVGFVTQTLGLQTISAGKAAFITGMSVVLVPLLTALLFRRWPRRAAVIGAALAFLGLGLMTLSGATRQLARVTSGDGWALACAFGFAAHIMLTGRFSIRHDTLLFTLIQLLTVALLATIAALLLERDALLPPPTLWLTLGYMGALATGGVYFLQSWAQRYTSSTTTALIFTLEPVFAALFAVAFAGEQLGLPQWVGGLLILGGMLAAELGHAPSPVAEVEGYA